MHARVPLDVDLEDRLLYGLTPIRLAYIVLAGLGALATWSSALPFPPVRAFAAIVVLLLGSALAWGRWRGRPADGWVTDVALFIAANRRVTWDRAWRPRFARSSDEEVDRAKAGVLLA